MDGSTKYKIIPGIFNNKRQQIKKNIKHCYDCGNKSVDFVVFNYRFRGMKWVNWFSFYCDNCFIKKFLTDVDEEKNQDYTELKTKLDNI